MQKSNLVIILPQNFKVSKVEQNIEFIRFRIKRL